MVRQKISTDNEKLLLMDLITSDSFIERIIPQVDTSILKTQYSKIVFKWILSYYEKYHKSPGILIKDIYLKEKEKIPNEETASLVKTFISNLSKEYEESNPNIDFDIEKIEGYIKERKLEIIKDDIENGNYEKAEKDIAKYNSTAYENKSGPLFNKIGELEVKSPEWLVHGLLEKNTTCVLFGEPGSGKSLILLDIGASIASGLDFHCFMVDSPGAVVYICGEGEYTIARRCQAWAIRHEINLADIPFYMLNGSITLTEPKSLLNLEQALKQIYEKEKTISLIIIDTWNRLSGGDENSNSDCAKAIQALDKLSAPYGCARAIAHHVGNTDKTRSRGASALRGATDSEYAITIDAEKKITVHNTKTKDGLPPDDFTFDLVDIDLGIKDSHKQPIYSVCLKRDINYVKQNNRSESKNRLKFRNAIEKKAVNNKCSLREVREMCLTNGMEGSRFSEVKKYFVNRNIISIEGNTINYLALRGLEWVKSPNAFTGNHGGIMGYWY